MLYGISFQGGRVERYRNRWIRTRSWGEYWDDKDSASLPDTNPNVNVISHAGEVLALAEGGVPLAITAVI